MKRKEKLAELLDSFVVVEQTAIEKMSDNELCRKLDIARRNIEKWQKRAEDIQNERSKRYMHYKCMHETEV